MGDISKSSTFTLFSDPKCHYSHRVRIALAEKDVHAELINVGSDHEREQLSEINPYSSLPTLVDRGLMLYESRAILEYLDERFPHPPLLPVYPVARAEMRQRMYRIETDWCVFLDKAAAAKSKETAAMAARELAAACLSIAPIFDENTYFMSEEFSLVDCCVAPILWRLPYYGIELNTRSAIPVRRYLDRVIERPAFQCSLSEWEKSLHPALQYA